MNTSTLAAIAACTTVAILIVAIRNSVYGVLEPLMPDATKKYTIWWVVDDSQLNSRKWLDWNSRTSFEPNEPYLALCLRRAKELWSEHFDIQPLIGRLAVHRKLEEAGIVLPDGVDRCPPSIWSPWCRSAVLHSLGGLWLDGSVLPLRSSSEDLHALLTTNDVLSFGTDPDEGLCSSEESAPAAGRSAGWSQMSGHPMWSGMERDLRAIISAGDQSWGASVARRSLRWAWDKHCSGSPHNRVAEVSRDMYGRRLELETLLGEHTWPAGTTEGGFWVPFPDGRDGLERASIWNWFLRMSEEQIRDSKFVWAKWASE
jgi:hypothetical protein